MSNRQRICALGKKSQTASDKSQKLSTAPIEFSQSKIQTPSGQFHRHRLRTSPSQKITPVVNYLAIRHRDSRGAEKLCLLQHKFRCFVLQIGRVTVFSNGSLNQNFNLRASAFAKRPVDHDALADLSNTPGPFMGQNCGKSFSDEKRQFGRASANLATR